jgi:hypothetical protein
MIKTEATVIHTNKQTHTHTYIYILLTAIMLTPRSRKTIPISTIKLHETTK